jgi:type VI secretion system protein ImpH
MGLIGPQGVLPYHYTQLVMERLRARDRGLQAFLDIFQHRIISLFYRAWEKHHFLGAYEQRERDPLTEHVLDLLGLGLPASRPRPPLRAEALLFYVAALAPQPRSASALQQLLEDFFEVPVAVEQFVGGWYRLAAGAQCALGTEDGAASQLGLGAVVGDEMWDQQARVRIRMGPLARAQYDRFLPTGDAYELLRRLVRFFSHDQLDFELQLVLAPDDVPSCRIGADGAQPPALGWGTWLKTARFTRDADETVLTL